MVDLTNFPNSVTGKAVNEKRSRFISSDDIGGGLAAGDAQDIADAVSITGVPIIKTPAALLQDLSNYDAELAPGSYTRAQLLAASGFTDFYAVEVTVLSGTAQWSAGGALSLLAAGGAFTKLAGGAYAVGDFTITVDAESTVAFKSQGI